MEKEKIMEQLMGNMVIIMLVGYAILGFIIFHNIFDVFYFDLGRGLLM